MLDILNYAKQKEKYKDMSRKMSHYNTLLTSNCSMFKYDGFPDTVDTRFIEIYLCRNGACGFGKTENGDLIVTESEPCGKPDAYGIGTKIIGATPVGRYEGTIGETTAYGFNNRMGTPDLDILWTADMLSEVDKSLNFNVLYARCNPVPIVDDEKQKSAIETVLSNMFSGKLVSIISSNILKKYETGKSGIDVLNISDVSNADKLQYLTHIKDDIKRDYYTTYGQCSNGTGKMAQQTREEITGNQSISFIIPLEKLEERKKMCDMVNKVFGLETSVDFSEAWKIEYDKFLASKNMEEVSENEQSTEKMLSE